MSDIKISPMSLVKRIVEQYCTHTLTALAHATHTHNTSAQLTHTHTHNTSARYAHTHSQTATLDMSERAVRNTISDQGESSAL